MIDLKLLLIISIILFVAYGSYDFYRYITKTRKKILQKVINQLVIGGSLANCFCRFFCWAWIMGFDNDGFVGWFRWCHVSY